VNFLFRRSQTKRRFISVAFQFSYRIHR